MQIYVLSWAQLVVCFRVTTLEPKAFGCGDNPIDDRSRQESSSERLVGKTWFMLAAALWGWSVALRPTVSGRWG